MAGGTQVAVIVFDNGQMSKTAQPVSGINHRSRSGRSHSTAGREGKIDSAVAPPILPADRSIGLHPRDRTASGPACPLVHHCVAVESPEAAAGGQA